MINHRIGMTGLLSIAMLCACGQPQTKIEQAAPIEIEQVNANNIKAHLEFLADDTLLGRDTGSTGYQIAANYVKSSFKQIGLTPMGEHGTFEQQVTFRQTSLKSNSAVMEVETAEGVTSLSFPDQFLMSGSSLSTDSFVKAQTVFVGYGVVSPDFEHDDYEGLDVEGKIVVALSGRPDKLPSEEGAHLGSRSEKSKNAAKRGAVGFITVHTPKRDKVITYEKITKYVDTPSLSWVNKDGIPFGTNPELKNGAYVNVQAAESLFKGAERSLADILADDNNNTAIKGFNLKTTVSLAKQSEHAKVTSPNIIAAIEGSDPTLKDEYVVFSAHLDHLGVSHHGDEADKINNGALDNASGVAILMETARLLSAMPETPKRSIMFVVVTGEEKGLLGSSYFANNPTVPAIQMVANVNLDMPLVLYPFADVIAFGATHSSLGGIVEKAAQKVDISLSPDPMPEQALFTRSDHYSFVKAGIPSVFLVTGFKSKDPSINSGAIFGDFIKNHYHQHSDELTLSIDYDAAATFVEVNMMIGLEISNQQQRPTWNKGDFFGKTFAE